MCLCTNVLAATKAKVLGKRLARRLSIEGIHIELGYFEMSIYRVKTQRRDAAVPGSNTLFLRTHRHRHRH